MESTLPRRKKKAIEQTDDEVLKRLFPKPVARELKKLVSAPKPKKAKAK